MGFNSAFKALGHFAYGVSMFFRNTRTVDSPRGAEKQKEIHMSETCKNKKPDNLYVQSSVGRIF